MLNGHEEKQKRFGYGLIRDYESDSELHHRILPRNSGNGKKGKEGGGLSVMFDHLGSPDTETATKTYTAGTYGKETFLGRSVG